MKTKNTKTTIAKKNSLIHLFYEDNKDGLLALACISIPAIIITGLFLLLANLPLIAPLATPGSIMAYLIAFIIVIVLAIGIPTIYIVGRVLVEDILSVISYFIFLHRMQYFPLTKEECDELGISTLEEYALKLSNTKKVNFLHNSFSNYHKIPQNLKAPIYKFANENFADTHKAMIVLVDILDLDYNEYRELEDNVSEERNHEK